MRLDRNEVRHALESTETHAIVLYVLMMASYGEEWLDWDTATVYLELREDFGTEPSSETMDMLSCVQMIMTTGQFFNRLDAFIGTCNTLSTGSPSFAVFDPATTPEIVWAITEVSLMRELLPFSYDVKAYMKVALKADGIDPSDYPDVLGHIFATKDPSSNEVKKITQVNLHTLQVGMVSEYVDDQLREVIHQFNQIKGLHGELDKILAQQDLEDAMEEL